MKFNITVNILGQRADTMLCTCTAQQGIAVQAQSSAFARPASYAVSVFSASHHHELGFSHRPWSVQCATGVWVFPQKNARLTSNVNSSCQRCGRLGSAHFDHLCSCSGKDPAEKSSLGMDQSPLPSPLAHHYELRQPPAQLQNRFRQH